MLKINGGQEVEGKMSVIRELDYKSEPQRLIIEGALECEQYIEEIHTIESSKYIVREILVYRESFGTETESIVYSFVAGGLHVK